MEVLISTYVDTGTQRHSYKNVFQTYAANSHEMVPVRTFLHKFATLSFFLSLTAKENYRLLEFLNDTLIHTQPEFLNLGTFKIFETDLKYLDQNV